MEKREPDQYAEYLDLEAGDNVADVLKFYRVPGDVGSLATWMLNRFGSMNVSLDGNGMVIVRYTSNYDGVSYECETTFARCLARAVAWHLYLDSK